MTERLVTDFALRGILSVLPTIFYDDGTLDLDGTAAVARATVEAGVSGLTVLGVMGEAAELSDGERAEVVASVRSVATCPVVLGVTGPSGDVVAARAEAAAADGASAVMVSPTKTLVLPDAVDAAAHGRLPIVVQDYPPASGVTVTVDELAELRHPLVAGVKAEAAPTSSVIAALTRRRPDLSVVGGLGGLFLIDELRAGAAGTMTGFALPERLVSIVTAFVHNPGAAEAEWASVLPLMRLEAFPPYSLAARKEVWRLRGVIRSARCRRAGAVLDEVARDDVRRALESVGVAVVQGA